MTASRPFAIPAAGVGLVGGVAAVGTATPTDASNTDDAHATDTWVALETGPPPTDGTLHGGTDADASPSPSGHTT